MTMSIKDVYAPDLHKVTKEKLFYTLVMFPYPSGYGLHVGHASNFVINDVLARYKRLRGYTVFNPFGFDSFGLPTENYAMKLGKPAYEVTEDNIAYYSSQVAALDLSFDTERTVVTSRPEYYKRTQRLFQQLYKAGLVYRDTLRVNRCPQCQTVLANDQVIDGTCERCKSEIIQKKHPQWFIKITAYADRLIQDLDLVDRPEETKIGQKNWIGKSEGMLFSAKVKNMNLVIQTFSAHFEACYADTFVAIAPEHDLVKKLVEGQENEQEVLNFCEYILSQRIAAGYEGYKEIEGIFTGRYIEDPLGNGDLPIWIASFALANYGTGIVKCSAHDERDFAFAKKYNIPLKTVLITHDEQLNNKIVTQEICFTDMQDGILTEPQEFFGKNGGEVREAIKEHLENKGYATRKVNYKLRDRSVSRQRYRGSPIPVYYDEYATPHLIPEHELPVLLPLDLENYKPTGKSPLEDHPTFPVYNPKNIQIPFQRWTWGVWNFHEGETIMTRKTILAILYDAKQNKYGVISWIGLGEENYTFVLGGIDLGESSENAAYREIYEETGYKNYRLVKKLGEFQTEFRHAVKKRNQHNITDAYLFELLDDERDGGAQEENENLDFIWMSKEEILGLLQVEPLRNYYLRLASGEEITWAGETIDLYNEYNPIPVYHRECDTLDTFMCSSFYFLRYPDANNTDSFGARDLLDRCFPIDFYIGGKEHTVGHLLYARFIHKFLYDQGWVTSLEPFQRLVHQGMVLGADSRKMSKRWGNVIDPMEVIEKYGSDAVRTYLMFMGPVEQEKVRNDGALAGIAKFLHRIEQVKKFVSGDEKNMYVERALHKAIKGITEDMEKLKYNTAVSKLMILLNSIEDNKKLTKDQLSVCLLLLFPFAPQTTRQIWTDSGLLGSIDAKDWPVYDESLTIDETISLPVQINGKVRANVQVAPDIDESTVLALAMQEEQIKKYTDGNEIRKVIYVQGKILNIVL